VTRGCGNDPRHVLSDSDAQAVAAFRAYLLARKTVTDYEAANALRPGAGRGSTAPAGLLGEAAALLTVRQLAALRLAANGLSDSRSAAQLGISPAAATGRLTEAYRRLGVHDRAHAVAVAWVLGVLTPGDVQVPEALSARLGPREDPEAPMPHPGGAEPVDAHAAPQEASL
jgi:DNA-binding CsgD family transcriptional regulator